MIPPIPPPRPRAILPKPYYEHGGITIYHGDCRDIVPKLGRFDLLLTDPPYGIGEHGGKSRTRGVKKANHENTGWDNETPSLETFQMLLAKTQDQIIWGGNYFADKLPVSRCWLYWRKLMGGDFSDGELAWTSRDAVLKEFTKANKGQGNEHPTQKHVDLIRWCIGFFPDCATILDPFLGSGTTARAAKDLGKKCVGIEREEKYCEIAARRLQQEVLL